MWDYGYVPPQTPASPVTTAGTWRIEGRYVSADSAGPKLTWAGTRFTFRFQGTSVTITYKDDTFYAAGDTFFNWYDVIVDGSPQPRIAFPAEVSGVHSTATKTVTITAPTIGVHEVTLIKRTEEVSGVTQILGFDKSLLLLPTDTRTRKIEFVGDSLTSGFGIDSVNFGDTRSSAMNPSLSYGAIVAARLKAEAHIIACAGKGLVQDATGGAPGGTMSDRWLRVQDGGSHPYTDGTGPTFLTAAWDFSTWQANAVVVNLGTNDLIAGVSALRTPLRTFYQLIRTKYPNAKIVALMPSQPIDPGRAFLRGEIQGAITDAADAGISFLEFPLADVTNDGQGGAGHPSAKTQQKQASLLVAHLQSILGWR